MFLSRNLLQKVKDLYIWARVLDLHGMQPPSQQLAKLSRYAADPSSIEPRSIEF